MEAQRTLWKTNSLHCTVILFLAGVSGSLLGSSWAAELHSRFSTSNGRAAAAFWETNRGSGFIWDYDKDSKGLLGIFKCKHDLGGWWFSTLLNVELQLHIYLQLLSNCFEHFLCKTEFLGHVIGMAVAVKGLCSFWEQSDLHKGPVTSTSNLLHRSIQLKPPGSIFPVVKRNGSVWLRAQTLPIPNVVLEFWVWVSPVPSGEYNYCQQASAKQGSTQGSYPRVSPMGTHAGDTEEQCWTGIMSISPWLMAMAVLQ